MLKKIFLSLLVLLSFSVTAEAAEESFKERAATMSEVQNIRFSYGSGTVRIVVDMTKETEFKEFYAENPSRLVLDIKNAWLSPKAPREIELDSTAAKKIRVAQFDSSTVRVVVETMADTRPFLLGGGPAGNRLVIDVGNTKFKENPELNKPKPEIVNPPAEPAKKPDKKDDKKTDKKSDKKSDKKDNKKSDKKDDKKDDKKSDKKKKEKSKDPLKGIDDEIEELTGLKGKVICIDPGHGGNDPGAIGPSGVMEKTVTLKVALELEKLLKAEEAEVIMTRNDDSTVSEAGSAASDIEELEARCQVANEAEADIFISIHADSFTNPAARGMTAYYYGDGSADGQRLANCIRLGLLEQLKTPSRGTQPCNFYVVRHTDMPATLIELGFISNADEEKLLNSKEGVTNAAQGILDGIEDYFG